MKWDKYRATLPRYHEESEYQIRVTAAKKEFAGLSPPEIAERFKAACNAKWAAEVQVKELALKQEALSQMLVDFFESSGLESVRLTTGGTISGVPAPYPKLVDRDKFYVWLREHHPDEPLVLPSSSLARIVRERLQDGEPIPDGVETYIKTSARLTGGRE